MKQINYSNSCQSPVTDNGEAVESHSAFPRVISYIPYGEIFVEQQSGAWQSPYLFNAKELDSETGLYYYGARYLDPSEGMWLSVDPLWEKYVGMSPYGYCAGNPVRLVDVDGRFTINAEDSNLNENQLERFKNIVKNFSNLFKNKKGEWDETKLSEISKMTGRTIEEIKSDFEYGKGPEIKIEDSNGNCQAKDGRIIIDKAVLEELSNCSFEKAGYYYKDISKLVFGVSMLVLHEYGHWGDQKFNNGFNTGQWFPADGKGYQTFDWGRATKSKSIPEGKQYYTKSFTGHRGDDITKRLFGATVSFDGKLYVKVSNSSIYLKDNAILTKMKITK